jgi:kynureninase
MDYDKLQENVGKLEKSVAGVKKGEAAAMKTFSVGLKDILVAFLKDRRESIRPGQIFKDAAAKSLVPGDIAARGDALLMRWTGNVTPQDPQAIKDDAARLSDVADKVMPVLKSYKKDK